MAKRFRWLRWTLAGAAVLIVAAIVVPFFVPLSPFIPQLAERASKSLGQPVVISDLQLRLLPTPRAVALGLRVGKREEVKVGELQIVPDLLSLLSGTHAVRLIRAEKVELKEAALKIPDKMPKGGAPVDVRRVALLDVRLQHSALRLPAFDADLELEHGTALRRAKLASRDGAVKVFLDPADAGKAKLRLEARKWRLPVAAAPLLVDALKAEGSLAGRRLDVPKLEANLYGGTLHGGTRLEWGKLWQLAGTAKMEGVDAAAVQRALAMEPRLSGRLSATGKFASSAKNPEQLANALAVDGPFNVADGVYQGVDLSKVGDLTGSKGAGGTTRFDELRGVLQLRGKKVRIDALCARSSALVAGGFVEVAPDRTLHGRLGVSVAKTAGFVGVPVTLSGTAQDPVVRPTRGYTIGAVVGTVLLPGVGTALGGSAGGALEGRSADCR